MINSEADTYEKISDLFDDEPAAVPWPGAAPPAPAGPLVGRPQPALPGPGLRLSQLPRALRQHGLRGGVQHPPGLRRLHGGRDGGAHVLHLLGAGLFRHSQVHHQAEGKGQGEQQ